MKKGRILLVFVAMLLAVSLVVFPACKAEEAPTDVAELEERIAELEAEIEELTAPPEVIRWVAQTIDVAGDPHFIDLEENISDWVEAMSDGRLVIEWHAGGELVPNTELYEAVAKGTLDMGVSCAAYWRGDHPVLDVEYGLPFGPRSVSDNLALYLDYGFLELLQDYFKDLNLYYVSPYLEGAMALYSKVPIRTPDDFEGLKVRTIGLFAEMATQFGASVIVVPLDEVYMALSTGVIEAGGVGTVIGGYNLSLYEPTDYILDPFVSYAHAGENHVVNLDSWNALPDDLKAIVTLACWNRTWHHIQWDAQKNSEFHADLAAKGIERTQFSEADEAKATAMAMMIWDDVAAKDPAAAEAVEMVRKLLRDRGQLE